MWLCKYDSIISIHFPEVIARVVKHSLPSVTAQMFNVDKLIPRMLRLKTNTKHWRCPPLPCGYPPVLFPTVPFQARTPIHSAGPPRSSFPQSCRPGLVHRTPEWQRERPGLLFSPQNLSSYQSGKEGII